MTTDIDPAFADRCADAATSLRLLAELGAHPQAGSAEDVALAEQLAERMLADPEALLAVALTIEQARAGTAPAHPALAAEGFHRIGRIDVAGRRSLWLREETGAVELRAGREGDDERVRITADHPQYRDLASVLSAARFAAEWEDRRGHGLDESFALDRCTASVHRTETP